MNLWKIFRSFVISSFIGILITEVLYIHIRLSSNLKEFIKVEYFGMVLTILLGIAFFLTPMPEIENMKLKLIAKASRSFCITISIILTIYYYIFTMEQIYGEQIHLEVWRGLLIIYGALFFRLFFSLD